MNHPQPYVREGGAGSKVVCMHANASTSAQWRDLIERLSSNYHVMAPDSYGAGKSPDWHSDKIISLRDELGLIDSLLTDSDDSVVFVGHSYGAAVALIAALAHRDRVRALALYEPTLFSLIDAETPPPNDADGIRHAVKMASAALDEGDPDSAAEAFIDYWMGVGSWANTPEARKQPIAASMKNVRRWAHALMNEPAPLAAFRQLDMPILYMVGSRSTASAHGVARVLVPALPRVRLVKFDRLGHMGPITNPDVVNSAIEDFLKQI